MSTVNALVRTPVAAALSWALIHFLWEGALLAGFLAAAIYLVRPVSARVRYALACATLAAMLAAFCVTLAILWPAAPSLAPVPRMAFRAVQSFPDIAAVTVRPSRLPWVAPLWMAGVLIFYVRAAGGWLAVQKLRRRAAQPAAEEWQARLRALANRLGLERAVALLESHLVETPVAIGFLRPAILMPVGLLSGLTVDQVESILLHELAHIRRFDYAVNVLQTLVESLLFYHPAVWWVSSVARAEREHCCDDIAVETRGDARGYAEALAELEHRRSAGAPAMAATGGNLMKRIRRLMEPQKPRSTAGLAAASVALLSVLAAGLFAWTPAPADARRVSLHAAAQVGGIRPLVASPVAGARQAREVLAGTPHQKWLEEDVVYIIQPEERAAFLQLQTNDGREQFIEQFWLRRDPTPGAVENEYKEEHYRRIAYANDHFAEQAAGWGTDRGHVYIV